KSKDITAAGREPWMSKSVTKARIVLIQTECNRMIPRFPFMRSGTWSSFVTDVDIVERDTP
ncbi:hypothetical protein, partial [Actinomyces naeslundii]